RALGGGAAGRGVRLAAAGGESGPRAGARAGMPSDATVKCLVAAPHPPAMVYAGTAVGLYCTDDGGGGWTKVDTPMNGSMVWSMAIDPIDSSVMFAGTGTPSTPRIYRSTDAGKTSEAPAGRHSPGGPHGGT